MQVIQNINELSMPPKYKAYLSEYLQNIADIPYISRVILFGSCARGTVTKYSDIDLFVTVNREITEEEEYVLMAGCLPLYSPKTNVSVDILVQYEKDFDKYIDTFGMVQKQVNKYGVDLSELL